MRYPLDNQFPCPTCYAVEILYEKKPKFPDVNAWVAPEHYFVARSMQRVKGELVIEPDPIFAYSRNNPPTWITGNVRIRK